MLNTTDTPASTSTHLPWTRLRRWADFLGSGRLAVALLALLTILMLLYLFVPQISPRDTDLLERWTSEKGWTGELARDLWLTNIQGSPWLVGTCILLFVNLLVCMILRFRPVLQSCRFPQKPPLSFDGWLSREIAVAGLGAVDAALFLKKNGYRPLVSGDMAYGLRGRFAFLGHWAFHVCLLAVLLGCAIWISTPASFRGVIGIGEGEEFDLHRAPFLATNKLPTSDLPELRFMLQDLDVVTSGEDVRRFEARIKTMEGGIVNMGFNRPYRKRPYQVLVHGFGHMPGWVVIDKRGRMRRGAWVKLVPFPLKEEEVFSLGFGGGIVHVQLFPDGIPQEFAIPERSRTATAPVFKTRLILGGDQVFEGMLSPEQHVPLGGGMEFFFLPEIRRYMMVDIIQERGQELVFAGFWIIMLSIAFRYVRIRKEIVVKVGRGSVRISGRSELFQSLFAEELDRLAGKLENENRKLQERSVEA